VGTALTIWSMRAVLFSTLILLVPAARAAGDSQPAPRTADDYAGVVPGRGMLQHESVKRKVPARPTVLWVGFRPASDGSARVFLQLNTVPTYQQAVTGDTLVVHVDHVVMDTRNDQRPLDTRYFSTPISSIVAKPDGQGGVVVKVSFKKQGTAQKATASVSQGEDGMQYLYLDFPPS
jgi:hypothetical protein